MTYRAATILLYLLWQEVTATIQTSPQREKPLLTDHAQLILVTPCLEAGCVSTAPPSSSYSIGQVHTSTPVSHLDELSGFQQYSASGSSVRLATDAEETESDVEWILSTKNIFLFSH